MTETNSLIEEEQPTPVQQAAVYGPEAVLPPLEDEEWTEEEMRYELAQVAGR